MRKYFGECTFLYSQEGVVVVVLPSWSSGLYMHMRLVTGKNKSPNVDDEGSWTDTPVLQDGGKHEV